MQQVVALLMSCTQPQVCAEAMEGGQLFVDKSDLQSSGQEQACNLIQLNPYKKNNMFEATVGCWDRHTTSNKSKHASNHGLWIKMEAYALKDLMMNSRK